MNGILGIALNVDAREFEKAKDIINDVGYRMKDLADIDVGLGGQALGRDAILLKQVDHDMQRLGTLASSGAAKGGFINLQEMREAANLTARITGDLEKWDDTLINVKSELEKTIKQLAAAEQMLLMTPGNQYDPQYKESQATVDRLTGHRDVLQTAYDTMSGHQGRAGAYAERSGEFKDQIKDFKMGGPDVLGTVMSKMYGWAAGLMGASAIYSYLNNASELSKQTNIQAFPLLMRGGTMSQERLSAGAKYGYRPIQQLQLQNTIGQATGWQDKNLQDAAISAMMHGNYTGVGAQSIANYQAGTFATGTDAGNDKIGFQNSLNKQVDYLYKMSVALGAGGRFDEVLKTNQQLLQTVDSF